MEERRPLLPMWVLFTRGWERNSIPSVQEKKGAGHTNPLVSLFHRRFSLPYNLLLYTSSSQKLYKRALELQLKDRIEILKAARAVWGLNLRVLPHLLTLAIEIRRIQSSRHSALLCEEWKLANSALCQGRFFSI